MDYVSFYWNYLKTPSPNEAYRGIDHYPNVYYEAALWTLLFCVGHIILPFIYPILLPRWYKSLTSEEKVLSRSYTWAAVHHTVVVSLAFVHLVEDVYAYYDTGLAGGGRVLEDGTRVGNIIYGQKELIPVAFTLAYYLSDTIMYSIPSGELMYCVHHVFCLMITLAALYGPGEICRMIPHAYIVDITSILLGFIWFGETAKASKSIIFALKLSFATLFFITRVVNYPMLLYAYFIYIPSFPNFGFTRFFFLPLLVLQLYWFYLIVLGAISGDSPNNKKKTDEDKQSKGKNE